MCPDFYKARYCWYSIVTETAVTGAAAEHSCSPRSTVGQQLGQNYVKTRESIIVFIWRNHIYSHQTAEKSYHILEQKSKNFLSVLAQCAAPAAGLHRGREQHKQTANKPSRHFCQGSPLTKVDEIISGKSPANKNKHFSRASISFCFRWTQNKNHALEKLFPQILLNRNCL